MLDQIIEGKMKAHFIMDGPAGNSYLQNVHAPEDDQEMKVEWYKHIFDQNKELWLNDMKTESYEQVWPHSGSRTQLKGQLQCHQHHRLIMNVGKTMTVQTPPHGEEDIT
ncbi:Zinc finger protein ZPR1 [Cricetulus griseus]|uniref:Zinc finger protein ZPR1 n=1 Tax=Cricetulus griseus TaxID=10029 RepID=G3GSI1_CRIGR|nr:Zinc finger protein ZPR1 [Cricetulus griseus]ERE65723.1 zinc finger protein ZPR1 isoform 1 [Cricetulus griseus]